MMPIAVFAFNRPGHLQHTLFSLTKCKGFDAANVTVFCDGPRNADDVQAVTKTRVVAREVLGAQARIQASESNIGIFKSIVGGVTSLTEEHGEVVVIEDDLSLSPNFLTYMQQALDVYRDQADVFQIAGHMFDVPDFKDRHATVLLDFPSSWGWATWRRAWRRFDRRAVGWEKVLLNPTVRKRFNLGGVYDYGTMLRLQMTDEVRDWDWDVRWYLSIFQQAGRVVYPPQSLVRNFGQDGSGVHGSGFLKDFSGGPVHDAVAPTVMPVDQSAYHPELTRAVHRAIWRQNGGWPGWGVDRLKRTALGQLAKTIINR